MNTLTKVAGLIGVILALLPWRALAEAKPTHAAGTETSGRQSVFINEPDFGKDPFFPKSTRRPLPKASNPTVVLPPPPAVPDEITLKGINLLKDRRFCIINNHTVSQGEEFGLNIKGKVYRVRCVEIKDQSVVISVNGVNKELPLRSGL